MELPSYARSQQLALAGGGLAILGALLPWATIAGVSYPGYYGDGFIVFMAGVTIVGMVFLRPWTLLAWVGVAVFALLSLLVTGNALRTLLGPGTGVGPGLIVQLVGALLALVGSGYATREPTEELDGGTGGYEWEDSGSAEATDDGDGADGLQHDA